MELDGVLSAARKSDNGALLHKVFDLARRKLQEAGADGIDKYTAKDVRKLRKVEDHANFRDDCLRDMAIYKGGRMLLFFEAFWEWRKLGIDPEPEVLTYLSEQNYDELIPRDRGGARHTR